METVSQHILDFISLPATEDSSVSEWSNGDGYGSGHGDGAACGGNVREGICIATVEDSPESLKSLKSYNGQKVYHIEDIAVILHSVVGHAANCSVIQPDMSLKRGVLVRYGNSFGFAEHSQEAFEKARELSIKRGWEHAEEDPIAYMHKNYPDAEAQLERKTVFDLHNVLTGSCLDGREEFIKQRNISLEGTITLKEFFDLSKYEFGKETIAKVAKSYGINI